MQITVKQNERRVHRREEDPSRQLEIIVDGQNVITENWSVGGFLPMGYFI